MRQYLFTILLTAALTTALAWAVWRLSMRYKLYPGIRERDVHKTPTPRLGGVAMFLGVVAAVLVSSQNPFFEILWIDPSKMWAILGASLLIVIVGVADDLWDLDWTIKLGAQFLAAGVIAVVGGLQIYVLPIGGMTLVSSWTSIILTMFSIVVVMNAVNFIDGLDGLVAGVCLIANSVFFVYSYLLSRDFLTTNSSIAAFLAATMIGACGGFLVLNWRPAKLFMGDSGALLLGLLMATSALAVTGSLPPELLLPEADVDRFGQSQLLGAFLPILLPLVIVLLPLADLSLAVIRRLRAGKSPFSPDRKHLHHRMLDLGHSDRDAVLIFYAWTSVISLAVLLMYLGTRDDWLGSYWVGVAFGVIGIVACLFLTLTPTRRRAPAAPDPTPAPQEATR